MRTRAIAAGPSHIKGDLTIPEGAIGIILFAHGSGSSRFSPRNQFVAKKLQQRRLATFLIDLLTPAEESIDTATAELRFDIPFLAKRLRQASDFLLEGKATQSLHQGFFGASTGAAAAIIAAAQDPDRVFAVVSRGGRPDLARDYLSLLRAPTLLIVGGDDAEVLALNRQAAAAMNCEKRVAVVPGATHLFEEPGTLEAVAELASDWFTARLDKDRTQYKRR